VTPAAVSQQIKLLEDYLGVTLFKRGKSLVLNESAADALHHFPKRSTRSSGPCCG
jgi:LysR family glycine cleavage system transcriptional activator